jgi:hypothetical protein
VAIDIGSPDLAPIGDDTLVFMHLPKTGGTALRSALQAVYEPESAAFIYAAGDLEGAMTRAAFEALTDRDRERLRLVMGHFPFGIHVRIGHPSRYVTLVRDPVERVVSLYYHYRNLPGVRFASPGHRERLRLRWRRVSLEDWVFREERVAADNLMVRNLAGATNLPFGQCDDALYARAVANAEEHFAAILATDDMERSVAVMRRLIGRELPPVGRENANPRRPPLHDLDPAMLARIADLNRFDRRLHQEAREWLARVTR